MGGIPFSVIVADDDPDIVDATIEDLLALASKFRDLVEVFPANSATDVLDILTMHRIDAILLDYFFEGGMNGDEIIDSIVDPFHQKMVILMSAREIDELQNVVTKRRKRPGIQFQFLRKPFDRLELQDKYLEIEQFVLHRPYPGPIAYSRNAFLSSLTAQSKLTALKDMVESIAKFIVATMMAEVSRSSKTQSLSIKIDLNSNLTLGAWLQWIENLLEYLDPIKETLFMPELINNFFASANVDGGYLNLMRRFKDEIRDPEIGHGFAKEEGWYSKLVDQYGSIIQSMYDNLAFISRYTLFVVENMKFNSDGSEGYTYQVRTLMGSEARFPLANFASKDRLNNDQVYFYSPMGTTLSLHPLITYRVCNYCSLGRIYMIEAITPKNLVYNAFCNHQYEDEKAKSEFNYKLRK